MKKKVSLIIRTFFSLIHITFVKILNIRGFRSSAAQDFALSTRILLHGGGKITLGRHIHAKRNVVFEADGGNIEIGEGCFFNNGSMVVSRESIKIGAYTSLGPNTLIYDHDHRTDTDKSIHDSGYKTSQVVIGRNVWIGANSVILRGTILGDNCVVGAGSVIKGEYAADSVIIQKRAGETVQKRSGKEVRELV